MLLKNTVKKIKKSFGRYLSLLLIVMLGVLFFTGIKESIPNIKNVQTSYYHDTNLMDLKLLSTVGFNEEDIQEIEKVSGVDEVVGSYSKEVLVQNNVVKLYSIEDHINQPHLKSGVFPTNDNECLADARYYNVGDVIYIHEDYQDDLMYSEYKVVGTILSPIYTTTDYGNSSIGNGKLYSYLYIPKENFQYEYYTEVYLTVQKNEEDVPYSKSYDEKVSVAKKNLEVMKEERLQEKLNEFLFRMGSMSSHLPSDMVFDMDWYILTRDDVITSYTTLNSQYDQVTTIANVIPIFFILIVALMTSNTMSRMIVEERGEMGTLASLGIGNFKIIATYLFYVLTSTILGSVIGYFIGTIFIPSFVYDCFPVLFPEITYHFNLSLFLIVTVVSCIVMLLVTVYSCLKELKMRPAYLLRPVAPKSGRSILLEKVGFIWNRLSFSSKITTRNISRYKKRSFMTVIGTMGCTFLIMIGFALKDSINTVGDKQFNELFKYDNFVLLKDSTKEIDDWFNDTLDGFVSDAILFNQTSYKVVDENVSLDVYMIVPESTDSYFYQYFNLRDAVSQESLNLDDDGVIITPKIKKRFQVDVGDTIVVESSDQKTYSLTVDGVAENYVSNYIYISPTYYEKIFGEEILYNAFVSKNVLDNDIVASSLLDSNEVLSVHFREDLLQTANDGVSGLNNIVLLLVVISSFLAFSVLYNLTSINISERIREIATLKVLGFKDIETNEYIYRETLIMVIVGIFLGLLITPVLHSYIMDLLETDTTVFLKEIKVQSYLYSAFLTFSFAIIMQVITYFKLKKVNMIESLKSVE